MSQHARCHLVNQTRALVFLILLAPLVVLAQDRADLLLLNARIYTVNTRQPRAEALAIRGDRIIAVGTAKEMEAYRGPSSKTIDAQGHLILPGFTDCHIHFLDGSLGLTRTHLDDATSVTEIQRRVKNYAEAHPKEPWILGRGWLYPVFGPGVLPDKRLLDEVVPDRPVYLEAFDGHSWWANSKALAAAGITRSTPNPPGGVIVRDAKTGEPTGVIEEDAADSLI